jgi:hydrogenase maturation protease
MSNSSVRTAVVGLGNILCRDDGIGIRVLEDLKTRCPEAAVTFLDYGVASVALIPVLQEYDRVLLIDAINAGLMPGAFKIFRCDEALVHIQEEKLSSHEMSLADLVGLLRAFEVRTDVRIAGVQVKDVSYGLEMTDEISRARADVVDGLVRFLSSWDVRP